VAGVLRLWGLGASPNGTFRDEWEKGYTALELWHTGRHGVLGAEGVRVGLPVPLFIEVFEGHDRTSAVYQWVAAPFVGVGGLNDLTTRLPAAIAGWLVVLLLWFHGRLLFGERGGLLVLAAAALHPTAIIFSRWAQQGVFSLLFAVAGFLVLQRLLTAGERHRSAHGLAAGLLLALSAYAYDPARLGIPLAFGAWLVGFARRDLYRPLGLAAIALGLIWIPLAVYTFTIGSARLERIGLAGSGLAPLVIAANWLAHFDPRYLLLDGDANGRHGLAGNGWAAWVGGGVVLAGLGMCLYNAAYRREWRGPGAFVFFWLATSPIAAAVTNEGIPHALRSGLMIAPWCLAAGLAAGLLERHRAALWVGLGAMLLVDGGRASHGLRAMQAPSRAWESETIPAIRFGLNRGGRIYLSAEIPYAPYAALYAERTAPAEYHEAGLSALRTIILPPGQEPVLRPGDVHIFPPREQVKIEWLEHSALVRTSEGLFRADRSGMVWRLE
jgi:hypothetical protein